MRILATKFSFAVTVILSFLVYFYFGYFFERTQFITLLILYSLLFGFFIFWQQSCEKDSKNLFKIGVAFRFLLIFSTPFLSQDFYRFIWDGRLILIGINPYQYFPTDLLNNDVAIDQSKFLVKKMGELSANHYSNYPPLNQFLFYISALFSSKSVFGSMVILKITIVLADIGIYIYGKKLLLLLGQNSNKINWYFLNPLVLLELTGNLHFEGVMLFFLVISMYYFYKNKMVLSALLFAFSISIKLIPLLLLPLLYKNLGFKKSFVYYAIVVLTNIALFVPFVSNDLITNYSQTVGLWFTNFEFNASIYYLIREIGFWIKGYNIIGTIGKFIPFFTIITILYFSFFKRNESLSQWYKNALFVLTIYLLISTTVHPWYIINLILLGGFTNFKFPIVWSFVVILSYYAYSVSPFKENYYLLLLEYIAVLSYLIYEIRKPKIVLNEN
jgi:alpha-1,6-mannosyltransferase